MPYFQKKNSTFVYYFKKRCCISKKKNSKKLSMTMRNFASNGENSFSQTLTMYVPGSRKLSNQISLFSRHSNTMHRQCFAKNHYFDDTTTGWQENHWAAAYLLLQKTIFRFKCPVWSNLIFLHHVDWVSHLQTAKASFVRAQSHWCTTTLKLE